MASTLRTAGFTIAAFKYFLFSLKIDIFRSSDLLPFLLSYVDFLLRTSVTGRKASLQNICCGGIDIRTLWGKKHKTPMDERRELHFTSSAPLSEQPVLEGEYSDNGAWRDEVRRAEGLFVKCLCKTELKTSESTLCSWSLSNPWSNR